MWNELAIGVEKIMTYLEQVAGLFREKSSKLTLDLFKMTKSITRPLKDYKGSAIDLPHV